MQGLVIAGTHSGCGKTTVTLGILAALSKKGLRIRSFKAGPDFIDMGLHSIITGRPSINLDVWMCGEKSVINSFARYTEDVDIAVVEGVMGMYDGEYSTAHLAALLNLPVLLVVDAYGMAESAGAIVKGFADFGIRVADCGLQAAHRNNLKSQITNHKSFIAGVVFNRVASERHYERLKKSVHDMPVLGYLPRDINFEIPHRHLGLMVAEESPISDESITMLADTVLKHIDVDLLLQKCHAEFVSASYETLKQVQGDITQNSKLLKIAVAHDKAFCFYYEENMDLLRDAGAEIVRFSLLSDSGIPDGVDVIYIGGGYPEIYAGELSRNINMLKSINEWAAMDKPIYAECGGLMYLSQGILDFNGTFYKMAGVFQFRTRMKKERAYLGYREIILKKDCILGKKGAILRGHEFHYSTPLYPPLIPPLVRGELKGDITCYSLFNNRGEYLQDEGYSFKNTLASYVHIHFGSNAYIVKNFVSFIKEQ
ncbi:MAG: cobyrinic acid a,c-diamide synthase [Thermodesulfovibrio sp.]|nr:cobyrinic acid a,c-diamide synthase [Thermodesulfovibrio sp.]